MAKITQQEYSEIMKQKRALFALLLKKTGVKKEEIYRLAMEEFINANWDELTTTERRKFNKLVFV
ncbi:MAG: hypothetical protein IKR17_03680 [Bacteroidales bacterium]|nr:hypothetical protein [Bacteroidales bacterium]